MSPRWLVVGFHDIGQGREEVAVDAPPVWAGLAWHRNVWSNRCASRWLRGDDGECKVPGRSTNANHWGRLLEYRLGSWMYFEILRDSGEVESSTTEYLQLETMRSRDLNLLVIHRHHSWYQILSRPHFGHRRYVLYCIYFRRRLLRGGEASGVEI